MTGLKKKEKVFQCKFNLSCFVYFRMQFFPLDNHLTYIYMFYVSLILHSVHELRNLNCELLVLPFFCMLHASSE